MQSILVSHRFETKGSDDPISSPMSKDRLRRKPAGSSQRQYAVSRPVQNFKPSLFVTSHVEISPTSPYAYFFIIGGVHETNISYKGFLYNVLVATRLLRRLGSTADMICHLQLAPDSDLREPPTRDVEWLHQRNISTVFLPYSNATSFTDLMMTKFQALKLTQYRRVLYLNADVMPLSNLDYLFHLSDPNDKSLPTLLQPNIIQASSGEPANGGMFMMEPKEGHYQRLLEVMERQRQRQRQAKQAQINNTLALARPFDNTYGWGHSFLDSGDDWHAATRNGTLWFFHGGFADQGLLYYFFKYEVQQVSAIVGSRVEDWMPSTSTAGPRLAQSRDQLLLPHAPIPLIVNFQCQDDKKPWRSYKCYPPYRDFCHFVGRSKPWQRPFREKWFDRPRVKNLKGRSKLWFLELRALDKELQMGLDIPNWNSKHLPFLKESPLGYIPLHAKWQNGSQKDEDLDREGDEGDVREDPLDDDDTLLSKHEDKRGVRNAAGQQASSAFRKATAQSTRSPYAYAFIVGSVHENQTAYKGFLYNVLISVQLLRRFGSRAEYVIYLQLSPNSQLSELPEDDIRHLEAMGIHIVTLPKPQVESFSDLMFDKFRIFQLTQYERVMYLDADVMPLTNLDYLFELSDPNCKTLPTPLLPNVMQASSGEPANGGLFMVRPYKGAWEKVQDVIAKQREEGKTLPYPNFHRGRGWGHKFRKKIKDNWHGAVANGTNWVFHGAHADQGLLYYFFRFILQKSSHIVGRRVENWVANASDPETPHIGVAYDNILMEYSNRQPPVLSTSNCIANSEKPKLLPYTCYPPYRDFYHFSGRTKPWQNELELKWLQSDIFSDPNQRHSTVHSDRFWFWQLGIVNHQLGLGLKLTEWNSRYLPTMKESPLGYLPLYTDNTNRIFENRTAG